LRDFKNCPVNSRNSPSAGSGSNSLEFFTPIRGVASPGLLALAVLKIPETINGNQKRHDQT
jgi:hypothetical protein